MIYVLQTSQLYYLIRKTCHLILFNFSVELIGNQITTTFVLHKIIKCVLVLLAGNDGIKARWVLKTINI